MCCAGGSGPGLDPWYGGIGTNLGPITVENGALRPGLTDAVGILRTGDLLLDTNAVLRVRLAGAGGVAGVDFDQVDVTGSVTLNLASSSVLVDLQYNPAIGATFTVVKNNSAAAITGRFQSQSVRASYGGRPYAFRVNYAGGDGNDIDLVVVPLGSLLTVH